MATKKATKAINIDGMKKNEALETLIKSGMSFDESETYWKENGSKRGAQGFRTKMYDAFLEQSFDKDGLLDYMAKNGGSSNDKKNINSYLAISALVERAKAL